MDEFLVVKLLYSGHNNDNCHLEEPMFSSIYLPFSNWAFGNFYAYIHYKRLILIEAFICCDDDFRMIRDNESEAAAIDWSVYLQTGIILLKKNHIFI